MSLTATYTAIHQGLLSVARAEGIRPHDARVLLALLEADDYTLTTDELEAILADANNGSGVRRSLLDLYKSGHVTGEANGKGGPPKRGIRTRARLTPRGEVAAGVIQQGVHILGEK
jgi:hypothetical protein